MDIGILVVSILMLAIFFGLFYLIKRQKITSVIKERGTKGAVLIMIVLLLGLGLVYSFFSDAPYRKLRGYGFYYEKTGVEVSPTWDEISFFSTSRDGKQIEGPWIAGPELKVKCRDIDKDGIPEFVIQSEIYKTYQTILKVDINSGSYHVQYTKGLKVNYPQEGYRYL